MKVYVFTEYDGTVRVFINGNSAREQASWSDDNSEIVKVAVE
jgi:hypothetical protein